jgi:hypothetical protein
MAITLNRRWFQFSLKTMLVVMTLVGMGLGWLAYERNEVRKGQEAIAAMEPLLAVIFDKEQPFRPRWLRPLLGDNSAGEVVDVITQSNHVTDAELVHLKGLRRLELLNIAHTEVTDAGLVQLKGLTQLRRLYFDGTEVTDAGLVHLTGLTELELLELEETQVTDAGLVHLRGLKKLKTLILYKTKVTELGVRELQKALPNVEIVR